MKTFVYFYFMKNEPAKIKANAPLHAEYWNSLSLPEYRGGPFADRSGGLIIFKCNNEKEAKDIIAKDPFITEDLLSEMHIKEWFG